MPPRTKKKKKKRKRKKKSGYGIKPKKRKTDKGKPKKNIPICKRICRHEKCHHLKFVKYLQKQKKNHNINFFASLLPYNTIWHPDKYGIIRGMPDFFIDHPLKDKNDNIVKSSLYIELKVGDNRLTKDEKLQIRKILRKGNSLVGVNYGFESCKNLMELYRNREDLENLEFFCWEGKTKKKHLYNIKTANNIKI